MVNLGLLLGTLFCGCTGEYMCTDCGECYIHRHERILRCNESSETWSWYGIEFVPDSTGESLVTVGSGCFHGLRCEGDA